MMTTKIPPSWKAKDAENLTAKTLYQWLEDQAKVYGLRFLLAHADDGVIWGEFRNGKLVTADSAFSELTPLRLSTLQQCRIFGSNAEVMLWQSNGDWKCRTIDDSQAKHDFILEKQILWGTYAVTHLKSQRIDNPRDGFTLVAEGRQGFHHAVPLTQISFITDEKLAYHPLRLEVRHYIDYDEDGAAQIVCSRLVNVFAEPKK